jgi:TetR/AcrR family transcriptional regulator, ethionamide resistance regulator
VTNPVSASDASVICAVPPSSAIESNSSTGRRRGGPSKGDLKEAAILDTAWRLLAEKPVTAVTIEELAAGAGISRSSFYFYFDSRDAVVRALADRVSSELRETVMGAMKSDLSARGAIRAMISGLLERWRLQGPLMRAMDVLAQSDPASRRFWSEVTDAVVMEAAAIIDRLRATGAALSGPPSSLDLAWALTHMYWRTGQQASLDSGSSEGDERLVETLTIITLRAIYGTE